MSIKPTQAAVHAHEVRIDAATVLLDGTLSVPKPTRGIVLFAHGSGSSRHSPRNQFVAHALQEAGLGTLLMDLLTRQEEQVDLQTRQLRFNIRLLAERLAAAVHWLGEYAETRSLAVGTFGASTGAAAALIAAAERPEQVKAVVSRGGRPDLAGDVLVRVRAPTLLIVGGNDPIVQELNREAFDKLRGVKQMRIVPGATHLFEEPGTLEQVARMAGEWFGQYL